MLGKKGQWALTINGDEILGEELIFLNIFEDAGLNLPTFDLLFYTDDEEKVKRWNSPGYPAKIGFGVDEIVDVTDFKVFSREVSSIGGADQWAVNAKGIYDSLDYVNSQRLLTFNTWGDMKKSSEVFSAVASKNGFKPDVPMPSNDMMLWTQHNVTDRKFLEEVTWHGYFSSNDPPLTAFRKDGKAIYKPLSKIIQSEKGIIGNSEDASIISNHFTLVNREGFLSSWSGNIRTVPYHHSEKGIDDNCKGSVTPKVVKEAGLTPEVNKFQEIELLNDNVHDNWWVAYRQNKQFKASLSSQSIRTTVDAYNSIFPLDYYRTKFLRQDDKTILEPYAGKWIVNTVVTSVKNSAFTQFITLCRETLL